MARCEVQGSKAESAARRLLPFLLVKRDQALLLLEIARTRPHERGRARRERAVDDEMESLRQALSSLHSGSWRSGKPLPVSPWLKGYRVLGPEEFGWSREELFAYLAGVIDSDGNLRVEKRRVTGMIGPHYRIGIRCSQVVPSAAVELLARTFGGRIGAKRSTQPNHRDLVSWSLSDKSAARAVEALLPYLRVKPREAQMLLELRGLKVRGKKGFTMWTHRTRWQRPLQMRKRCYTPDQNAEFERIHRAVQALHAGGSGRPGHVPSASANLNPIRESA